MLEIRMNNTEFNQDVKLKNAARALIIKDNRVAILYSKKYNAYITPGGGLEDNESFEEACIREAKEETGLVIKPVKKIAILDCNYPHIRIVHNYFICDVIEETNDTDRTEHENDQDLEVRWLSLEDVKKAYSINADNYKYDLWMQREFAVISELRNFLK